MLEIGNAYALGRGTTKNPEKGFYWIKKAADQGLDRAFMRCAIMLEKGEGTTKNIELAIEYYKKAAEKGISLAIKKLEELGLKK